MRLEFHTRSDLFSYLQPEWNALLQRSFFDQLFSTWEWNSTWWHAYHPGELQVITFRDEQDVLRGIAPLFVDSRGVLQIIGAGDVTDYLELIVDADYVTPVLEVFASALRENHAGYGQIELWNLPENSPTLQHLPDILRNCGFDVAVDFVDVCPLIHLPENWEGYLGLLDKKQRHEVRRKVRRANGFDGVVDWYMVEHDHDLDAETALFLRLMAESGEEKRAFLQNTQHTAFFRQLIPVMFQAGWLRLSFLTIDGAASASYLNFAYNKQILVYNSGLSPENAQLSAGVLLLIHTIRHAIENGYAVFDFLRGDETYKYRMGGQDTRIFRITARLPD